MRSGISITLTAPDRVRLEALVADRNTPQKHVWLNLNSYGLISASSGA
jgi:hypothetical protein